MNFTGNGQPMTRAGLTAALQRLGLGASGAAYVWAVVEVETAGVTQGFGFRADRRPQMLFERHKFREFTAGRFDAEAPEVSGPPGGYGSVEGQYDRLARALALCDREGLGPEPALLAASWGLGQVMGFNCDVAGFPSAAAMVDAMLAGEDAQLDAMVGFLVARHLDEALREHDWVTFAKRYNGANYWKNHYDVKLRAQYERFASGSLPDLEVRAAQGALRYLGYAPGKIDGVLGPRTRAALRGFRTAAGLSVGDDLDGPTYAALRQRAAIDA